MPHRDALAAALARIAALEAELARLGGAPDQEVAALRAEHARLTAEAAELRSKLAAIEHGLASGRPDMPTVYDHNRARPPLRSDSARALGVLCPVCVQYGDSIEMCEGAGFHVGDVLAPALCPRCGFSAFIRK